MNKIISINIGGLVFQIEEEAYERLEQYLSSIRARFGNTEGGDEILADIEARIAEMLSEKISMGNLSVNLSHIEEVIKVMGDPGQIADEDEDEENESNKTYESFNTSKRLYRDPDDKVIGGVCSGIGHYFGIDPVWMRAIFAVSFFMFGTGILVYIILYIIIPEAKTSADKLRMHGEKINIDNLERRIKEEMEKVRDSFSGNTHKGKKKAKKARDKFVGFGGEVVSGILSIVLKIIGVGFAVGGLIALVFFTLAWLHIFPDLNIPPLNQLQVLYENDWEYILANVSLILLVYIPLVAIVAKGITLLLGMGRMPGVIRKTAGLTWLVAIVGGAVMIIITLSHFADDDVVYEEYEIVVSDTIYVDANLVDPSADYGYDYDYRFDRVLKIKDQLFNKNVRLDVRQSSDNKAHLEIRKYAQGGNEEQAHSFAMQINNSYTYSNDSLIIDASFTSTPENLWRNQKVTYTLYIPEGVTVMLGKKTRDILYDVANLQNMYDPRMAGRAWTMTKRGLNCANCNKVSETELSEKEYVKELFYQDFSELQIDEAFKVYITQGDEYKIMLGGKEKWVSKVNTSLRGDRLYFDMKNNWLNSLPSNEQVEIHITMPTLTMLEVSGASNVELYDIDQPKLNIEINGASTVIASLKANRLNAELNGTCKLRLIGEGDMMDFETNGASTLSAANYKVKDVNCDMSGVGLAKVWATNTLAGDMSGVSTLEYKGSPEIEIEKDNASKLTPIL